MQLRILLTLASATAILADDVKEDTGSFSSTATNCSAMSYVIKGSYAEIPGTACALISPKSDNVALEWNGKLYNSVTLFTDTACKNVAKAGKQLKSAWNPVTMRTCLHPSQFGGEVWGSMNQAV